jgi:hypothetical protein
VAILSPIQELWLRVRRSFKDRGLSGTLAYCLHHPSSLVGLVRSLPRYRNPQRVAPDEFDRRFGLDTATPLRRTELGLDSANLLYLTAYGAIPEDLFHKAIERVGEIDYERFTFVDLGSGKGRALFLASEYPFRKIVGVELSPRLHAIAKQNLTKYHNPLQKCMSLELINEDFVGCRLPDEPLFCFMYNPCEEKIMTRLAEKVAESFAKTPRLMYLLYFAPRFSQLWEKVGFEKIAEEGEGTHVTHYCLYRKAPAPSGSS